MYYQADEKPVRPLTDAERALVDARREEARKEYFRAHEAQVRARKQAAFVAREAQAASSLERLTNKFGSQHAPREVAVKSQSQSWSERTTSGVVVWNDEDEKLRRNKANEQPSGSTATGSAVAHAGLTSKQKAERNKK